MTRYLLVLALIGGATACASAPPPPPPKPAGPTYEQKMAWILRLEDQRILRQQVAPVEPPPPAAPPRPGQRAATSVVPPPPPAPDLVRLLSDTEARVRRRAALAIGHVGVREGIEPLVNLLKNETDPEVRQMAAFALGLIGDAEARAPLVAALTDSAPIVQGSAAEALGSIGDATAADSIARMLSQILQSGALAQPPGEEDDVRRDTATAAFRLGVYALVRLKAYPQLASVVLDQAGQPRVRWWPVAFALQRLEDKRSLPALITLSKESNPYTRAFAVKGLNALGDPSAVPVLMPLLSSGERSVLIEAIRALGHLRATAAAEPLVRMIRDASTNPQVRLEAVNAISGIHTQEVTDTLIDLLSDRAPAVRASALKSLAALDRDNFVTILSGLDPDSNWSVRAALASVLATLPSEIGLPRLTAMANDSDQRVVPSVLAALVKLKAPNAAAILLERLKADDPAVRAAAAEGIAELKPANGAEALADAYRAGQRDPDYAARAAALGAIAEFGAAAATPVLKSALADKDWAIRVRAVRVLAKIDPAAAREAEAQIRPAPTTLAADVYEAPRLVTPPVSIHMYIDTDRGSIEVELAMIDAPLTVENFIALAKKGFFNGLNVHRVVPNFVVQDGDPRGDGSGGPGYSIRDELNQRPFLRGTLGMALDAWPDSGGSQWFITHSPQPHLDGKYTAFGRVVNGMDIVDQIQQSDVIRRVRVWDGVTMTRRQTGAVAR
jgi:HEAT repeat protein/cyclophilin family peptidyl-prolyl cis-trans isomerase